MVTRRSFLSAFVMATTAACVRAAPQTVPSTRPADTELFSIHVRKPADRIDVLAGPQRVVLDVVSPSGIGGATIRRNGDRWPELLVIKLQLRGLESFSLNSGKRTLVGSRRSHTDFGQTLRIRDEKGEEAVVQKGDPLWTRLDAFNKDGKPAERLPGEGGWFEVIVPTGLLAPETAELKLDWIDFYRR